jgi:hypothetical protein
MTIGTFRVAERGQMALLADARHRWNLSEGGTVEIADLGHAIVLPKYLMLRSVWPRLMKIQRCRPTRSPVPSSLG